MAVLGSEDVEAVMVRAMMPAEVTRGDALMRLDCGDITVADALVLLRL
jgi:hypothetical protein